MNIKNGIRRFLQTFDLGKIPLFYKDGSDLDFKPNPLLDGIHPYWLTFDEVANNVTLQLAANSEGTRILSNDTTSMLDLRWFVLDSTSRAMTVELFHTGLQMRLMNRPLRASTFTGTRQIPYKLPFPLILDGKQEIQFCALDQSGAPNTVRFFATNVRLSDYSPSVQYVRDSEINFRKYIPFWYTTDAAVTIPQNATTTATITISEDSDYLLRRITLTSNPAFLGGAFPAFEVQIQNLSATQSWMNTRIYAPALCGETINSIDYASFDPPILLKRGTMLRLTLTDNANTVGGIQFFITLHGAHYYPKR